MPAESQSSADPISQIDDHLKTVTNTLFTFLIQAYDHHGPTTTGPALTHTLRDLASQLSQTPGLSSKLLQKQQHRRTLPVRERNIQTDENNAVNNTASTTTITSPTTTTSATNDAEQQQSAVPISLPPEVIQYVETGRNPDIYTREFVELTQRNNQHLAGRSQALTRFGRILAEEIVDNCSLGEVEDEEEEKKGGKGEGDDGDGDEAKKRLREEVERVIKGSFPVAVGVDD